MCQQWFISYMKFLFIHMIGFDALFISTVALSTAILLFVRTSFHLNHFAAMHISTRYMP